MDPEATVFDLDIEHALREGYASLIESIPDVIVSFEYPSGKILYINRAVKDLLGYEPAEFYGTSLFMKLINADDRKEIIQRWRNMKNEGDFPLYIYKVRKKDGSSIWVEQKNRTVKNEKGETVALNAVFRDISLRKHLEEQAHKNFLFSENLILHSPYAVVHIASDGSIKRCNPAFERLYHLTLEDFKGYSVWEDDQLRRAGITDLLKEITTGRVVEIPVFPYTLHYRGKKKQVFVTGKGFPVPDESAEATGIIVIGEDVTEQKQREEEYIEARKLESIGRLAGGIAHDFNNMLAGISGYAEIIMRKLDQESQLYKFAENIHTASMKAATLTGQLLGFARRRNYNPEYVDIAKPIVFAIGATPGLSSAIKIEKHFQHTEMGVFADLGQMRQVFVELFKNAVEAMAGAGTMTIQTEHEKTGKIVNGVSGISNVNNIKITVSDTGAGIPPEIESKIFEPYFTTKDKAKHAGMGLAVAYGIIKNHGGRIDFSRQAGGGTNVTITLPAVRKPARADRLTGRPYRNILIIDDSEETRSVLRTYFEEKGCRVSETSSGKAGIELFRSYRAEIDLVFVDYIIPDISGRELVSALLQEQGQARILILSGYSTDRHFDDYIMNNRIHIIPKPFRLEDLESVLI